MNCNWTGEIIIEKIKYKICIALPFHFNSIDFANIFSEYWCISLGNYTGCRDGQGMAARINSFEMWRSDKVSRTQVLAVSAAFVDSRLFASCAGNRSVGTAFVCPGSLKRLTNHRIIESQDDQFQDAQLTCTLTPALILTYTNNRERWKRLWFMFVNPKAFPAP